MSLRWQLILPCMLIIAPVLGQESPFAQAQAFLKEGKAGSALPILLELYRAAPSDPNLCQQIGIAYTQLQDLSQAEKFYREAVRLNPQFLAARKNLGTVLWFLGRKDESEGEFLIVTRSLPDDPVPHLYLGLAAATRHQFPRAKQQFEQAGTLAFANSEVLAPVLESYLATGDLTFPTSAFEELRHAEDPDVEVISRVGALFLQYGYYDQAIAAFEKIISAHKESAETWRLLAEAYDRQHKPDLAYRAYSRALEINPPSEETYIALAEFASAHANNDYALQVVSQGLDRLPDSSILRFEQGILLALKGDRSNAQASFSEASRLKPDWSLPLLALGVSELESGNASKAAAMFNKACTADPRDPRAWYLYALALSKETGQISGPTRASATAALQKAIALDSNDAASHTLLGHFELIAGNSASASHEWEIALRLDPQNATALYQLALLYRKQGRTEDAHRLLERFQQIKGKQQSEETHLVDILRVVPQNSAH
jgi:tetratricopeptide (TPR) repeat protein